MTQLVVAHPAFAEPAHSAVAATAWLATKRERALETFRKEGVPHRRVESWKYSDLKAALDRAPAVELDRLDWNLTALPAHAEFFDFRDLANAPGWVRDHLGEGAFDGAVAAASLAFAASGFAVRVPDGLEIDDPVHLEFSGSGHARVLILVEAGASLTLVERPSAGAFSNLGVEVVLGRAARFTHLRLAGSAPGAIQVEDVTLRLARDAHYRAQIVNCGAAFSRLNLRMTLKEPGAHAEVAGVTVLGAKLHSDTTTQIDHASGETNSVQLFKKAIGGEARAVYQGKITVAEGANGSDSRQTAKALLLSDAAEADLKPELEILADDVKCAHGAAIGDLDDNALFYLRSRGIPESEARSLLIHAFLEDVLAAIDADDLREEASRMVEAILLPILDGSP